MNAKVLAKQGVDREVPLIAFTMYCLCLVFASILLYHTAVTVSTVIFPYLLMEVSAADVKSEKKVCYEICHVSIRTRRDKGGELHWVRFFIINMPWMEGERERDSIPKMRQ